MNIVILNPNGSKELLHEQYRPDVRFHIPQEEKGPEYERWLTELFAKFIRQLSTHKSNHWEAERFHFAPDGQEGGTGGINIADEHFDHCKLFAADGVRRSLYDGWQGVWMRNHFDQRSKVKPLYLLAESFERFLQTEKIPYKRFGRLVTSGIEIEQVTRFS